MKNYTPDFPDNITEYAPWVTRHGLFAPYGECQCCCGGKTKIARKTETRHGQIRGEPIRFIFGHKHKFGSYESAKQAFWSRVMQGDIDDCWTWPGVLDPTGYGRFGWIDGKVWRVHRLSYHLHFGPIPPGMLVCHHCDVKNCIRPDHLFLGTNVDNMVDMVQKGRQAQGETHGLSKLTEADVREIRRLSDAGLGRVEISKLFGIVRGAVSMIVTRKTWMHVE